MSDVINDQAGGALFRRLVSLLNRKLSDFFTLLFHHKSSSSLGAVAGFAIAVVFAWRFLRSPLAGRRGHAPPKRRAPVVKDLGVVSDAIEVIDAPPAQLTTRQIVRKKLSSCRKVTCQLLGVVFEEKTPEELQKHATVRPSVVDLLLEISKQCDLYLMETVLGDQSEERALLALESAGLFESGGLMKDKVLFCSTEVGRTSFVRQLEADFHIDTSFDVISQLARFIKYQLYVASMQPGQIASNVFTSSSLEHYFS